MSGAVRRPRDPAARTAIVALAITLAIQVFTSLAATATSVLVPEIGRDLGLAPKLIGVFVGLMYAGGMSASLVSGGFIERFGAIRVSQVCVLLCASGLTAIAALPPSLLPVIALAPILIGLGYGPITPASSQILVRTASPARMALTFSIKQTGVPLGAALAGAVLPIVALRIGWREGFLAIAAFGIVIAAAAQSVRAGLDAGRIRAHALSFAGVVTPLLRVLRTPALAELAFTGLIYAALQVCLMSFLIIYLTESLGFSLVAAGFALTAANIGGIFGRILWGAIADHFVPPRLLLGLIGVVAGGSAWLTVAFGAQWPTVAILAVCIVFGMTAIGWNGVQLAEVARCAPAGQEGAITGASGFITFGGVLIGPPVFALLSALTGGYRVGFATFGTISIAIGALMLVRHRK
jgi:MFS family permease